MTFQLLVTQGPFILVCTFHTPEQMARREFYMAARTSQIARTDNLVQPTSENGFSY